MLRPLTVERREALEIYVYGWLASPFIVGVKRAALEADTFETVEMSWLVERYPSGWREARPTTVETRFDVFAVPTPVTVEMRLDGVT